MITENGKYYLYRHIRNDLGTPFYIGIGQKENNGQTRPTTEYRRAFVTFSRNKYWKSIIKKTPYDIEIMLESNNKKFIEHKEKEFISLYGRKDDGSGILANMTNGGDYYPTTKGHSNGLSLERRREIRRNAYQPPLGTRPVNVFVYSKTTGAFIKQYPQIKQAAADLKISNTCISVALKKRNSYKDFIFSNVYIGEKCSVDTFNIKKDVYVAVLAIHPITFDVVKRYNKSLDAANELGICKANIPAVIRKGTKAKGYYWKYDDGLPFFKQGKRNRYQQVQKIDATTKEILCVYETIKEAAHNNGYKSASGIKTFLNNGESYKGIIWKRIIH